MILMKSGAMNALMRLGSVRDFWVSLAAIGQL
jgi:hypothetical protein